MNLWLDGERQELFFGCSSFMSVSQIIKALALGPSGELQIVINGKTVERRISSL